MPTTPAAVPTAALYTVASGATLGVGNTVPAAPVAEFIGSPTSGTTPLTVTFTDQTTGTVSSWAWDFGDGGTSTSQNPSHAYLVAGTYTVALTATGPGGSNTRTRSSYVSASSGSVVEPPTSGGVTITKLRGGSAGVRPFSFGQAFKQGDLASAATLNGAQLNVLTTWPDGTVKTALVSGYATISAGTDRPVALATGSAPSGSTITTAALASLTAAHDCGSYGTVSWGSSDWATPHLTVCTGPVMSSWVFRKAVNSDPHLVAWLEVRAFSGGEIQVLPWVENGYINVASPTNKSATYAFTLAGTQRMAGLAIDLKHHQRTPLINGSALSYWAGSDPGIVPIHDAAYLQATELVPSYYSALSAGDSKVTALPSSYAPLQQGSFTYDTDAMTSTGYQAPIGLLPQHDVLHLIAADADRATTFAGVVRAGFSAGRYPIHYRDESTNKPLRFQDHPNRVISNGSGFASNGSSTTGSVTPTVSGTLPPSWDTAHSPSVGFMAHLLTGWRYFLEEAQFAATANYLGNGDNSSLRNGSQGLTQTAVDAWQTRASAWDWRTHAQALAITPSTDYIYTDLLNRAHNNVDHFHGRYVAQANNAFGIILPGETYAASISRVAIWQQDFHTAAWGYSKSLGLPLDATRTTKLGAFFDWKAQSIIGRLGTSGTFPFENANRYTIELGTSLSTSGYTAGTGPWPASWAAIYSTTTPLATSPDNPLATAGGNVLATEYDATSGSKGQWGEMQMAIAYAVRHGVSGASAAYNRMIGATNWASMLTTPWASSYPVMGVKPYTDPVALPAWRSSMAVNQIKNLATTSNTQGAALNAWGTLVLIDGTSTLVSPANGGHTDSSDNRVTSIDLSAASPAWSVQIAASASVTANASHNPDGKPGSRHGYHHAHYIAQRGRVMLFGQRGRYSDGGDNYKVDGHSVSGTWAWDAADTWAATAGGQGFGTARDALTGNVVSNGGYLWTQASNTWVAMSSFTGGWRWPVCYDSTRDQFFALQWADGQGFGTGVVAQKFNKTTGAGTAITFNASSAYTQFQADQPCYAGMDYDPVNDCFLFYAGQSFSSGTVTADVPTRIYKITPNGTSTWDMSLLTVTGDTPANVVAGGAGINGRWRYIPALSGFYCQPAASAAGWFLRTS